MSSDSYSNINNDNSQIYYTSKDNTDLQQADMIISERAVWRALFANIGIAGIKLICWFFSRSSAMLSEAIHSGADSFNSLCLLIGLKRGSKPADKFHPFGYGLEANIWALFACILMLIGTGISLYNGYFRLILGYNHVEDLLNNYHFIIIALIVSILFEIFAVSSASLAVVEEAEIKVKNSLDAFIKSFKYINHIKSPTTKFVWYEDTAALTGVIIALVAITISKFFMPQALAYIPDAIASIIIGLMLLALAIYLAKNNMSFLTGVAAKPQIEEMIKDIASRVNGVSQVHELKTMDMGTSGLIVNMEIEVDPETQVKDADDIADRLEERIREKVGNIAHVTIEVQADDTEENWNEKFVKVIEEGKDRGVLKPREAKMFSKFFDFTNTVVWEVMIPRTEVEFIDAEATIDELIDVIINSGHTRIPVYKDDIDDIIGVINAKDVLKVLKNCEDKNSIKIEDLAREITIVPENKSISDMLNEFSSTKSQIAAVVDEHGGVAGIVTVEDILEEIVGEIWDEYDVRIPEIIKIDENTLNILSKMDISDMNERFNLDLPTEDFQTIGGLVFGLLGREPEVGDEVEVGYIKMKVESMDGHKIIRVIMHKPDGFIDKQANEEEI
ncbi:MAG: cation diffusion facilitator family transporter [Candidatus Gastranaerophilales bacterium]|nr:cation diffusion facilitator family transporter [Candidatus Gastranaerophilales bacterium]